jgi:hypothetical protein
MKLLCVLDVDNFVSWQERFLQAKAIQVPGKPPLYHSTGTE